MFCEVQSFLSGTLLDSINEFGRRLRQRACPSIRGRDGAGVQLLFCVTQLFQRVELFGFGKALAERVAQLVIHLDEAQRDFLRELVQRSNARRLADHREGVVAERQRDFEQFLWLDTEFDTLEANTTAGNIERVRECFL